MKRVRVTIQGLQPLLMKSGRSVDPTDPLVKQMRTVTGKQAKKRTDSDLETLDRLEFELGLYWNDTCVYVPDVNVLGTIRDGAKANRRGREVQAGVDIVESEIPLLYEGPQTPDGLYEARWADRRMVKNKGTGGAVMRVRPRFNKWALAFTLLIDPNVMSVKDVRASLEHAGLRVGLGDFRPRFGRFEVAEWKDVA